MVYICIVFLGIILICAILYNSKEENKDSDKIDSLSLISTIPGSEKKNSVADHSARKAQESLDAIYARTHGMWICRHCETLNGDSDSYCAACGLGKEERA